MHQTHVLSTLVVSLVLVTPACGSKFVSLGDEDAGGGPGNLVGAGGGSPTVGGGMAFAVGGSVSANGDCVCTDPPPTSALCADGSLSTAVCTFGPSVNATGQIVQACMWMANACPLSGSSSVGGSVSVGGAGPVVGAGGSAGCVCSDPAPSTPNYVCSDGTMAGPICEPNANGLCVWDIRGCPVEGAGGMVGVGGGAYAAGGAVTVPGAGGMVGVGGAVSLAGAGGMWALGGAVTVGAGGSTGCSCSGPAPEGPNYLCWDGTIAGPTCGPDPSGVCVWDIRGCPVDGAGGAFSGAGGMTSVSILCQVNGKIYTEGQSFPEGDGCNTCYCTASGVACTRLPCALPLGTGGMVGIQ
jgi:hypothetical protein